MEYALAIYAYYECFKCKKPYFGGLKNCEMNMEDDKKKFDPSELICPACCPFTSETNCKTHGTEYIEYKCKYCCSVALWFCWGKTHFCDHCH